MREHPVRYLVLSFDTDWRFSTEHSLRIVRHLESNRLPVTFRELKSAYGHDSFLLADPAYHATLRALVRPGAGGALMSDTTGCASTWRWSPTRSSTDPACSTSAAGGARCWRT